MLDVLQAYADEINTRGAKRAVVRCTVPRCSGFTRDGKPWCSDHVLTHSAYAQQVSRAVDRMNRARASGRYTPEMLEDARTCLEELGELTVRRLAREMNVSGETALRLAERLARDMGTKLERDRRRRLKIGAA